MREYNKERAEALRLLMLEKQNESPEVLTAFIDSLDFEDLELLNYHLGLRQNDI